MSADMIAARLGFERPRAIRELITRNVDVLADFGTCRTVRHVVRGNDGIMRPVHRACLVVTSAANHRLFWLFWIALHGALVALLISGGCGK